MVVLFDVGNTSVTYAHAQKGRIIRFGSSLFDDIPKKFRKWARSGGKEPINLVVGSVVPKITREIKKWRTGNKRLRLWIAGENLPVPIRHKYKDQSTLGIDRQVALYGGERLYGKPLLVIDYGTAITMDYISRRGVFEGGLIIPGPELAFQALLNRAALISKKIRLPRKSKAFPGRDTRSCMDAGILEGYGAMTDELTRRFEKRFGKGFRIVVTGGFSSHLQPYCRVPLIMDPQLCLKSLLLLYQDFPKRSDGSPPRLKIS